MTNLIFVIWMIGFPLANSIEGYFFYVLRKETASDGAKAFSGLIHICIWAYVGYLLFEQ